MPPPPDPCAVAERAASSHRSLGDGDNPRVSWTRCLGREQVLKDETRKGAQKNCEIRNRVEQTSLS